MTSGAAERSPVDVSRATAEARREMEGSKPGPYRELMATYVALGELLDSGRSDADYVQDCHDLVGRLIKLGEWVTRESDQRWALWMAQNTTFGGDAQ